MAEPSLWHPEVVTAEALQVVAVFQQRSVLAGFYLAGGTGLAVWLGHRRSVDLDFFHAAGFDEQSLGEKLRELPGFTLLASSREPVHAHVHSVALTFLGYRYPQVPRWRISRVCQWPTRAILAV